MITKQHKWFAELHITDRIRLLESFAKDQPILFNSKLNHEYTENRPEADPDRELINITPN